MIAENERETVLEINHLTVRYRSGGQKVEALTDLSLSLEKGHIYALIGPSGCGKSTLLHVLCGILQPDSGEIRQGGHLFVPAEHCIGLVPQNYGLLAWQTVQQNIRLGCRVKKKTPDETLLQSLLSALELNNLSERYPHELSGGQRQRAAIARAFLLQPELLLLDEPFSALDALTREKLQELFLSLWKKHPATAVFVTHSMEEALYVGQEILVLSPPPQQTFQMLENPCFLRRDESIQAELSALHARLRRKLCEVSS